MRSKVPDLVTTKPPRDLSARVNHDYDVVIVGAGVAGLAAMREAERRHLRACIVEARDRIGGRIYTMRDSRVAHPIELGAEFIHGWPPQLLAVVCDARLLAYAVVGQRWRSGNERLTKLHEFWQELHSVIRHLDSKKPDRSFDEFLKQKPGGRSASHARRLARLFVEGFHAADAARISARWVAEGGSPSEDAEERSMMRIADGYDLVPDWLARGFRDRIMMEAVVQRIEWQPGHVQLSVRTGGTTMPITARAAIITAPLGVLLCAADEPGPIEFSPALPMIEKTRERLAMGSVVRVTLLFRESWWTAKVPSTSRGASLESLSFLHGESGDIPTWWSLHPMRAPALVGWVGGPAALRLAQRSQDEIEDRAISSAAANFGVMRRRVAAQVVQCFTHNWQHDPYSRGAYSYGLVGGADWARRLARPIERTLWVAGEAASRDGSTGTVHSAIASGRQAAEAVTRALG